MNRLSASSRSRWVSPVIRPLVCLLGNNLSLAAGDARPRLAPNRERDAMKTVLFLPAVLLVPMSAALAQTAPKPISRDTYIKLVDSRFSGVDTNHDGMIAREEGAAQQQRDI